MIPSLTPSSIQNFLTPNLTGKPCFTPSALLNVSLPLKLSAITSPATLPLSLPMRRSLPTWPNRAQLSSTHSALLAWTRILVRVLSMASFWFTTFVVFVSLTLPSGYVASHVKYYGFWLSYCIASHPWWPPPNSHLHHCREGCRCYQGVLGLNDGQLHISHWALFGLIYSLYLTSILIHLALTHTLMYFLCNFGNLVRT